MASFATPAELAAYAETPVDTSRMQLLLDLASGLVRREANSTISETLGDTVEFGPTYRYTLFLPEVPVLNVTAITVGLVPVTDVVWYRHGALIGEEIWEEGAVVVYDHGWATDTAEFQNAKGVCLASASRAFTMNERSASEVMGATIMESAGYAPEVFLTDGEKARLHDLSGVPVG